MVISDIEFAHCHSDHLVFVRRTKSGSVILAVYVNDILLTGSDYVTLAETKEYLKWHFVTKDMKKARYFLEIEVAYQKHGLLLSKNKYVLNLLKETDLFGANLLALQWKSMWIYGVIVVIFLTTLDSIGGWLRSWFTWQLLGYNICSWSTE